MSVYFVAVGGFIKVGFSDNPLRRSAHLFQGTTLYSAPAAAYDARGTQILLGYIPGSKQDEAQVHEALGDFSAGLEWFVDEQPVRDYFMHLVENPKQYDRVARVGGPVDIADAERAGRNVRAQEGILRKHFGDTAADQALGIRPVGQELTELYVRTVLGAVLAEDIKAGRVVYDEVTDEITKTAKWDEDFPSTGGVA